MKAAIHPQFFDQANVICVCGNRFNLGSTKETIHVELCNKCHPFYTGEQKFVDTASRIQKFETKLKTAQEYKVTHVKKEEARRKSNEAPKSLRDMLLGTK